MPTPTTNPPTPRPLSPQDLANQLFDLALPMTKGDPRETARQVIMFLEEALVYAVTSSAGDEAARKALLRSVGETIAGLAGAPAGAPPSPINAPTTKP